MFRAHIRCGFVFGTHTHCLYLVLALTVSLRLTPSHLLCVRAWFCVFVFGARVFVLGARSCCVFVLGARAWCVLVFGACARCGFVLGAPASCGFVLRLLCARAWCSRLLWARAWC